MRVKLEMSVVSRRTPGIGVGTESAAVVAVSFETSLVERRAPRATNGIARRRVLFGVVSFAARARITRLVRAAEHGCEESHEHE